MASNSTLRKSRNEDRISELPDAILCHILSFFSTREAMKTSILSHRWKNVWASVPNLDFNEYDYYLDYVFRTLPQPVRYDSDWFAQFVNRVLLSRCQGNIHRFCLRTTDMMNVSLIDSWVSTAIKHNVVELVLSSGGPRLPDFEIPRCLFMCNTLVSLELGVHKNIRAVTPPSHCFPCLKLLHVTFCFPDSHTVEKLFPSFPVLEDLIIDGEHEDASAFNLVISAPKLKRLQISFIVRKFAMIAAASDSEDYENYGCQIFVSADAPNLEELDIYYDILVSYSLKNAKCLRKAEIGFLDVKDLENLDYFLGLADRICRLFADICNAKYLTVSAPIFAALDIRYHSLLLTFSNLHHLELQLQTCLCLQSLTTLLKISPNLEHLKILPKREHLYVNEYNYCDDDDEDEPEHGWDAPESVPVCLISHLKTICLWEFKGCPNEVEVAKYLVKHGKALNKVTIYNHFSEDEEMEIRSPSALWSKFSKFPRGSKTCKIQFQTII
ncbi:F-box/LRR-repeat protein At4g14103-like [Rosa rugosa]|uniref:F-box/LRR-repeat protein At4g14103-like n=1 Tax=Rosa rugosa TaxID=74645 RepID=UPI002B40D669|nr:F-box/LRR-repeat protein At4g14103-like [Rosa rugosa]